MAASVQELLLAAQAQQRPSKLGGLLQSLMGGVSQGTDIATKLAQVRRLQEDRERRKAQDEKIKETEQLLKSKKGGVTTISVGPSGVSRTFKQTEADKIPPPELQAGLTEAIAITDAKQQRGAFARLGTQFPKFLDEIGKVSKFIVPPQAQRISLTKGLAAESAGKLAAAQTAIDDINSAVGLLVKKDEKGKQLVDRKLLFKAAVPGGGLPFSEGRDFNSLIDNALSTKLRIETGVAARPEEMDSIAKRFRPKLGDSDELIIDKMDRLQDFMTKTEFIIDPSGRFKEVPKNQGQNVGDLSDEELLSILNRRK